jgi:hypothetical protein
MDFFRIIRFELSVLLLNIIKKLTGRKKTDIYIYQKIDGKNILLLKDFTDSGEEYQLEIPDSIQGDTDEFFNNNKSVKIFHQYLVNIKRARLYAKRGLLKLPDGSYSAEHVHLFTDYIENSFDKFFVFRKIRRLRSPVYSLIGYYPGEYYHLMIDFTQRLYRIKELLPEDISYLIPHCTIQPIIDAYVYLGIPKDKMIFAAKNEHFLIDNLYWSPPVTYSGYGLSGPINYISETILKNLGETDSKSTCEYIYISRNDSKRKVLNEEELLERLSVYGFNSFELSKLSFAEKADLFAKARLVIAPHGAGLVNLIFCRPGTVVLELFPDPIPKGGTAYWSLANTRGMRYYFLKCKTEREPSWDSDIEVPIEKLISWVSANLREEIKE